MRGRKKPIDILFNLDHPEGPSVELLEFEGDEESPVLEEDQPDVTEDEESDDTTLLRRLNQRTCEHDRQGRIAWHLQQFFALSDLHARTGLFQMRRHEAEESAPDVDIDRFPSP